MVRTFILSKLRSLAVSKFVKLTDFHPSDGQTVIVAEEMNGALFGITCAEYFNGNFFPWVEGLYAENYDGGAQIYLNIKPTHWATLPEVE
jgi:hypothetical protein